MKIPLVSIIIPCYNQAQYLEECLQSVLNQTYANWECIIVNDGSPDNTEEVAQKWVEKDNRFKYVYQENGGLSSVRNKGISHANGEFILPLDADDKISDSYSAQAMHAFKEDETLKVVYCKAEKFGEEEGEWNLEPFSLKNLAKDNMIFCSAFFRKSDWESIGGFDINMLNGLEDWEFWIALLKYGGAVKCIEEVGFYYRIKSNSMIKQLNVKKRKQLFEYLSVKHADFFVKQLGSFIELNNKLEKENRNFTHKLKSEKFVIDLFCKTFFKLSIFGKYK